jgi:hypothetical protein
VLYLKADEHVVAIQDEPAIVYPDSVAQRPGTYQRRYILGKAHLATSAHGIKYGEPEVLHSCLLMASGGPTSVHPRSALLHHARCIVAVSSFLVGLQLPDLDLVWQVQVDTASCFGVYHLPQYESYLSHGELDIARVSYDGEILWSSSGKDIFTNGLAVYDAYIEVVDFNNEKYHIDLSTGHCELVKA